MKPEWRCWLCPASGHANTEAQRLAEFERHYALMRREKA